MDAELRETERKLEALYARLGQKVRVMPEQNFDVATQLHAQVKELLSICEDLHEYNGDLAIRLAMYLTVFGELSTETEAIVRPLVEQAMENHKRGLL